jgi:hypothetical protein
MKMEGMLVESGRPCERRGCVNVYNDYNALGVDGARHGTVWLFAVLEHTGR